MAATFPTSPVNGETTIVNGITYVYASAQRSWTRVPGSVDNIANGTSNVSIATANGNVTVGVAGTSNVAVFSTGGANITGAITSTGNVDTTGTVNINSTAGMYNVLNITGTALAPYGSSQTWKFFTQNASPGGPGSWILFPDSSTQTTAYPGSATALSLSANITGGNLISNAQITASGNITGGNLITTGLASTTGNITGGNVLSNGQLSAAGNITGGNILTVGQISSTGTITTAAGTNSTGFAVGNGAVSNVGLGFFPTAGTRGDYAIRDYSTVFTTMYLDAGMGGSAGGEFQFRSSNAFSLVMRANTTGVYSPGIMSATGTVYGSELNATNSQVNEGGQINLALPSSGSTLSTSVIIDVYQNRLRFFEGGGTARGAYIDLTSCSAGAATNLLSGGGGGTPGGANTNVQFNDGGTFGGNGQFTYDKVTNTLTAGIVAANNNGSGQNFKVGDDAWIGDINVADTMRLTGQQNGANAYIVFGNADGAQLGRAGTGPLTYAGAFSASGNITGGNIISSAILSVAGRTFVASGNASAPGITFLSDTGQDTGFYWISDGNIGVTTNGTLRVTFDNAGNVSATGNITGGNILTSGIISATGNVSGGNLTTSGQVSATGNITGGGHVGTIYTNSIINTGANATGNIGSSTLYFNTAFIKATSAQYADVAEYYASDAEYEPGTVVSFGGEEEITICYKIGDNSVAGVVSTNPAYVMNAGIQSTHAIPVALTGRVPTKVVGPVRKGNMMISAGNGYAQACSTPLVGTVIGKAIENFDGQYGIIEIVVGRV